MVLLETQELLDLTADRVQTVALDSKAVLDNRARWAREVIVVPQASQVRLVMLDSLDSQVHVVAPDCRDLLDQLD